MTAWCRLAAPIRRISSLSGLAACVALTQSIDVALGAGDEVRSSQASSTLTVVKAGGGTGVVMANSGSISCGATCSGSYADGAEVTLTASPTPGNQFTGWLGPCTGTGTCTFIVNGSTTISATFAAAPLTGLALDIDGEGHCDALSDGLLMIRYLLGQDGPALISAVLGLGATRNSTMAVGDYLTDIRPLLDIDGDGQLGALTDGLLAIRFFFGLRGARLIEGAVGTAAIRQQSEQIEAQIQKLCSPPPMFAVTVSTTGSGSGVVTSSPPGIDCGADCTESFAADTMVTLSAVAHSESTFTGWSGGGCAGVGDCVVTVDAAKAISANFDRTVCDGGLSSNSGVALDYAKALGLCETTTEAGTAPGVISAAFSFPSGTGSPDARSRAIRPSYGTNNLPLAGLAMVVMSTGAAAVPGQTAPAYVAPQPGLDTSTSSTAPSDWLQAHGNAFPNLPGCPPPNGTTAFNPTMLTLRIRVPANAHAFQLSTKFLSSEFPEYVCSPFNDIFLALLDSGYSGPNPNPVDKNLAAYPAGATTYPVGLSLAVGNTGLFTQCVNGATGCGAGAIAGVINTCTGTSGLTGTGLDVADPGNCNASGLIGGGTDWLQIRGNVIPGEIITLRLAIWDVSDGTYDSAVLLDNFTWLPGNVTPGAFP